MQCFVVFFVWFLFFYKKRPVFFTACFWLLVFCIAKNTKNTKNKDFVFVVFFVFFAMQKTSSQKQRQFVFCYALWCFWLCLCGVFDFVFVVFLTLSLWCFWLCLCGVFDFVFVFDKVKNTTKTKSKNTTKTKSKTPQRQSQKHHKDKVFVFDSVQRQRSFFVKHHKDTSHQKHHKATCFLCFLLCQKHHKSTEESKTPQVFVFDKVKNTTKTICFLLCFVFDKVKNTNTKNTNTKRSKNNKFQKETPSFYFSMLRIESILLT